MTNSSHHGEYGRHDTMELWDYHDTEGSWDMMDDHLADLSDLLPSNKLTV